MRCHEPLATPKRTTHNCSLWPDRLTSNRGPYGPLPSIRARPAGARARRAVPRRHRLALGSWSASYTDEWSEKRIADRGCPKPARRLQRLLLQYDLDRQWSWIDIDATEYGVSGPALTRILRRADLLVHVTGAGRLRERYLEIPCRAFVDTDPGYTPMRVARDDHLTKLEALKSHTVHFSFAGNINRSSCTIPHVGLQWRPTRQPIHFPMWPLVPSVADAPFSTVVKWAPYKPIEYQGVVYGMKDIEFLRFIDLPRRQSSRFTLAMEGTPPVPRSELAKRGWLIEDGLTVSKNLASYRKFLGSSRGEWSIAKHGYVATNSGWFSDRSASYMAMGRPVIVQSTGFEKWLPTGEGVQSFATMDDAVAALEIVQADYALHQKRAREIAHEYFERAARLERTRFAGDELFGASCTLRALDRSLNRHREEIEAAPLLDKETPNHKVSNTIAAAVSAAYLINELSPGSLLRETTRPSTARPVQRRSTAARQA